jgi:hypothetical protein
LEIELPDGTVLDAPDGADIKSVVAGYNRNRLSDGNAIPQSALASAVKYLGSEAARVGLKAITGIPLAFADVPVAIQNQIEGRPNTNLPSQAYARNLDATFAPPTTTAGKVSEGASEMIAGGGLGRAAGPTADALTSASDSPYFQNFMKFADKLLGGLEKNPITSITSLGGLHYAAPRMAVALDSAIGGLKAARVLAPTPVVQAIPKAFSDNATTLTGSLAALDAGADDQ